MSLLCRLVVATTSLLQKKQGHKKINTVIHLVSLPVFVSKIKHLNNYTSRSIRVKLIFILDEKEKLIDQIL